MSRPKLILVLSLTVSITTSCSTNSFLRTTSPQPALTTEVNQALPTKGTAPSQTIPAPTNTPQPSPTLSLPSPTPTSTPTQFLPALAELNLGNAGQIENLSVIGNGEIYNLRFTSDSRYLAVDSGRGSLVYEVASQLPADPTLFKGAFPNGKERIEYGQETNFVFMRDGVDILEFENPWLFSVSFDGSLLVTYSKFHENIEVWDLSHYTGQKYWTANSPAKLAEIRDFEMLHCWDPESKDSLFSAVTIHPNGPQLAGICNDEKLLIFTSQGELRSEFLLPAAEPVNELAFSPDGSRLAVFLAGMHNQIISANDGAILADLALPADLLPTLDGLGSNDSSGLAIAPDNQKVSLALRHGDLLLWNLNLAEEPVWLHKEMVIGHGMSFSADSATLAYVTARKLSLLDLKTGKTIQEFPADPAMDNTFVGGEPIYSPDGRYLVWSGYPEVTWDLNEPDWTPIPLEAYGWLSFVGNPTRLVGYHDGQITFWTPPDWQVSETIPMKTNFREAYGFSLNGELLAYGDGNQIQIAQRDGTNWKYLRSIVGANAYQLLFSPQGKWLAAAVQSSQDQFATDLRVYAIETGLMAFQLPVEFPYSALRSPTNSPIAFSPDGQLLATGSRDVLKIYNTTDGTLLATLAGHTAHIQVVNFSPDGNLIATLGLDGTLRLWGIPK